MVSTLNAELRNILDYTKQPGSLLKHGEKLMEDRYAVETVVELALFTSIEHTSGDC